MTAVDTGRAGGGAVCGVAPACPNLVTVLWLRKRTPSVGSTHQSIRRPRDLVFANHLKRVGRKDLYRCK